MRLIKIFSVIAMSLLLFSCNETAKKESNEMSCSGVSVNKIELIDFHSTHRCMTCNAIEANALYTLETYFAKELKDGKISFQSVNIDEEVNYAMAEKFEASGTSLFLNVIVKGQESIINLTDFAFKYGRDQEVFSEELKLKIDEQLKLL